MTRVLLVSMPFAGLRWPALGPSLLAAGLARRGIACDTAYLNFDFAERIGLDDYAWIADAFAFVLGGERLFAREAFPDRLPGDDAYFEHVLRAADPTLAPDDLRDYLRIAQHVGPFLEACETRIDASRYDVVGFSTSFQQTVASLGLARRIRRKHPRVKIVFGGAACESTMGVELLRQFPEIDYVCLGEADRSFPELVARIGSGRLDASPPGVAGRCDLVGNAAYAHGARLDAADFRVDNLDDLPDPDFESYFARLRASPLASRIEPMLFFETARGCWWGEKHQCVFCGLNGASLAFRSKSPKRAVDELRRLSQRYGIRKACAADNVFDRRYFDTFLPMLREANLGLSFVYEMKTNLTRPQVDALVAAGLGAAQLGVETFSTPLLRRIGKGATALDNVRALKWLTGAGVEVKWNLLYGFPGVDPASAATEYERMASLVPSLTHLAPPTAVGQVRLDRFAPYFQRPADFGIVDPRPHRAFGYVFPCDPEALSRLAYYHEFDHADGRQPEREAAALLAAVDAWRRCHAAAALRAHDRDDGSLWISDTRPCAAAFSHRLSGIERAVYRFCDAGRPMQDIVEFVGRGGPTWTSPADAPGFVQMLLGRWREQRLVAYLDDRYLSLALDVPGAAGA